MAQPERYQLTEQEIQAEEIWIAKAKKDPKMFEPLYNRYYETILKFIYKRISDKDLAFDITSQVFLKAMENIKKYNSNGIPFGPWLYRIARNEILQLFRKNNKVRTVNIDQEDINKLGSEVSDEGNEIGEELITKSLGELSLEEIELIEMRYFEKLSFKEIGEILDITENNAKVKTYRVLDKLKKRMTVIS